MGFTVSRRDFLASSATAALANSAEAAGSKTRVGVIGVGNRGTGLLRILLAQDVSVPAICDINAEHLTNAQNIVESAGQPKPEGYSRGEEDFRRLMERDDLDALIIAAPWQWHTPMAVYGMKCGKYTGVEVPCALTIQECWDLVNTHEETHVPCMMLENWSFRRDSLAVLNMIRKGLLGEIVHCHCAHSHDCFGWYFNRDGSPRWSGEFLLKRNADQYPTHSLGPVISWMDLGCGDYFRYLTATANRSLGINHQFEKRLGPDAPATKRRYRQSDIVTSVVKTQKGNTIVINNDMQLPRPYDNRWMIQGLEGLYDEERSAVYLAGRRPGNGENWEPFAPYQKKYEHSWWTQVQAAASSVDHDGADYMELWEFIKAVRGKTQTPIDVYDSVLMSAIIPLSEQSIAQNSAPVPCPDFTRGQWKVRKPSFALEA